MLRWPSYVNAYRGPVLSKGVWKLEIRDSDLSRLGEIEDYQRLEAKLRFNGVGSWLLDLDFSTEAARAFDFGKGIVVSFDGVVALSGPVTRMQRAWGADRDRLVVSGVDDNVWLGRRLGYPVPGGDFTLSAHDTRSGDAETVMRAYVDANLGPSALADRRIPGLVLGADQGRGSTVTGNARFETVLELLQSLALAGGDLGFRVIQVENTLEFQVYEPRDQSTFVIFSRDLGNLAAFNYETDGPEANYFIGAGSGEGTARVFVEKGDAASIASYGRIEQFRDRRDTADVPQIEQTLDQEIAAKSDRTAAGLTPTDTEAFAFLTDWWLGDRATGVVDGIPIVEVVRELSLTLTPDTEQVLPVIGTPGASAPSTAFAARLKEQRSRISSLERR